MTEFYDVITSNNNGQPFPDTQAIDSSGPFTPDGTELLADVVDDIWLEKQALLDFYNYPPNGLKDFSGVDAGGLPLSQPLAAQYMNYATPGVIVNWASETDPAFLGAGLGIDIRLLLLYGQGIDRTLDDYKMLDSIVYCGDANNAIADSFYHANDAAGTIRNIAGPYLILADMRGYSIRGLDTSGIIDPDGASRIVGDKQEDAHQNIIGDFLIHQKNILIENIVKFGDFPGLFDLNYSYALSNLREIQSTSTSLAIEFDQVLLDTSQIIGQRTAIESRGKNIAMSFAIYY